MLRGKYLKIMIAVDGQCSVDAINFTGPTCRAATMEVTDVIGAQIEQHDKPEARIHDRLGHQDREPAR